MKTANTDTRPMQTMHSGKSSADKPCVVLFGWQGCQEKHLTKYIKELWEPLGWRGVPFHRHCLEIPCGSRRYTLAVKQALEVLDQERPNVVHIFSNGGGFLWQSVLASCQADPSRGSGLAGISHVVYDSTPGEISPCSPLGLPRAFRYGLSFIWEYFRSKLARALIVLCICTPVPGLLTILVWLLRLQFLRRFNVGVKYHDMLLWGMTQYGYTNLFLYSEDDKLVDYTAVQSFIRAAKSKSCVLEHCWERSTHVRHFQDHREEYADQVRRFVA
eukprot:TRINITY_DN44142_c0_g1_i1.p1 TRINITY_DN44142_c0_g1~~TRINITY_DN44142_c0_g1_i1.p1  ORF type:complete len:273 (-),score=28.62 TRINITY_DN44142_c0_g1_i1:58-876(-)